MRKTLTLFELNTVVRETLETGMPDAYWVEAELSEAREVRGHCYMELIQKEGHSNTPIAKASAKCWASSWQMIKPHFERTTGQRLQAGMKVLLQVYAQFHESYGFSWIVTDIDPTYTMGDMVRKRQEIIRQLKEEGVFDLQKELSLPLFAQRIAVVSSAHAAGYGDFVEQLENNEYGFCFETRLFPAVMQGEGVERSVIAALDAIHGQLDEHPFDCVVIIRGGGATSDLSGFDTLALAENVANFPLPIITGIGHERDESVLDMVSHTRVKTPTAAAAFLVDNLKSVLDEIESTERRISALFSVVKTRQEVRIERLQRNLYAAVENGLQRARYQLGILQNNIQPVLERRLMNEYHQLELIAHRLDALDPERLLRRGYSITLKDGKAIRDAAQLKPGDKIETRVEKGRFHSVITD